MRPASDALDASIGHFQPAIGPHLRAYPIEQGKAVEYPSRDHISPFNYARG
jgi:hypothetical protein